VSGQWINRPKGWLKDWQNEPEARPVGRPVNDADDYGVPFTPLRCPKCGSKDIRCYVSRPPLRYHICRKCTYKFKSIEVEPEK